MPFSIYFFYKKSDILFSIILKLQTLGFFKKALLKTAVSQLIVSNSIFSILVEYTKDTKLESHRKPKNQKKKFSIKGLIIINCRNLKYKCDALRDLVPFAQLKKLEKHPSRKSLLVKLLAKTCCFAISITHP